MNLIAECICKHWVRRHVYHCVAFPLLLTLACKSLRAAAGLLNEETHPTVVWCRILCSAVLGLLCCVVCFLSPKSFQACIQLLALMVPFQMSKDIGSDAPHNKLNGPSPLKSSWCGVHIFQKEFKSWVCLTTEQLFTLPQSILNELWTRKENICGSVSESCLFLMVNGLILI